MLRVGAERWQSMLDEHLDKLKSLWAHRVKAIRSSEWTGHTLAKLDYRIEAHTDALELAGEEALPVLVPGVGSDSAPAVGAAVLPLARMGGEEAGRLLAEAFHAAEGEALEGFRVALGQVQGDHSRSLARDGGGGAVRGARRGRARGAGVPAPPLERRPPRYADTVAVGGGSARGMGGGGAARSAHGPERRA